MSVQPLLPRTTTRERPRKMQSGFSIDEVVMIEGRVVGFGDGDVIRVEHDYLNGVAKFDYAPCQLSVEVGPTMMKVLQAFCGFLDIWFLRETFVERRSEALPRAAPAAAPQAAVAPEASPGPEAPLAPEAAPVPEAAPAGPPAVSPEQGHNRRRRHSLSAPGEVVRDIEDRIEREAKMIFEKLNMVAWELDQVPQPVTYTFGLYLRYVLAPSVYFCRAHSSRVQLGLAVTLAAMVLHAAWGFYQLRTDYTDAEALANGARAFKAVEHAPVTPVVLLLCTHLIMVIFAARTVQELFNTAQHVPFPLTYPLAVGKAFMVLRMVMAYSSGNLGLSIDYFVWQELLLTTTHGVLATLVGDPSAEKCAGRSYAKHLARAFMVIFGIDTFKTLIMFVFWCTFKGSTIAYYFNRLPSIYVQLSTSVLVHATLDLIQTFVSVFTMFIGRAFVALTSRPAPATEPKPEPPREEDIPPVVKQLLGSWQVCDSRIRNTFSLKTWELQVPEGVGAGQEFDHTTLYEFKVPKASMRVRVPEGFTAGDKLPVKEVRLRDWVVGWRSYDASTLVAADGHIRLFDWTSAKIELTGTGGLALQFYSWWGSEYWTKLPAESS